MRQRLIFLFLLLSALCVWYAIALQGFAWLFLWPALSFALVSLAYSFLGPTIFRKSASGAHPWLTALLFGPYQFLCWLGWLFLKHKQGKNHWHEVAPNVFLGRRASDTELPPDTGLVIDLTCELATLQKDTPGRRYICLPTLDATAPDPNALASLLDEVKHFEGKIFVHCAAGYGRSATVVASLFLQKGLASSVEEAEEKLKKIRAGVRLQQEQRALAKRFTPTSR